MHVWMHRDNVWKFNYPVFKFALKTSVCVSITQKTKLQRVQLHEKDYRNLYEEAVRVP
jgi:hypothetical protein